MVDSTTQVSFTTQANRGSRQACPRRCCHDSVQLPRARAQRSISADPPGRSDPGEGRGEPAAQALVKFLKGDRARAIIISFGYGLCSDRRHDHLVRPRRRAGRLFRQNHGHKRHRLGRRLNGIACSGSRRAIAGSSRMHRCDGDRTRELGSMPRRRASASTVVHPYGYKSVPHSGRPCNS